jgi:hypothetical protein
MKKLILLLSLLLSQAALAFDTCCVCVEDPNDRVATEKECKLWLKRQKNCQKKEAVKSYWDLDLKEEYSCKKLNIFGAFHGNSSMVSRPFDISVELAETVSAKEVNYDGSTCLVFNNQDKVEDLAHLLTVNGEIGRKFSISGNQNMGVINLNTIFKKYKEIDKTTSKLTVIVDNGKAEIIYDKCSRANKLCGFARSGEDFMATSDSNEKICEDKGQLVKQICCVKSLSDAYGTWSKPGGSC